MTSDSWEDELTCRWTSEGQLDITRFPEDMPICLQYYLSSIKAEKWPRALHLIQEGEGHCFLSGTGVSFPRDYESSSSDEDGPSRGRLPEDEVEFFKGRAKNRVKRLQFLRTVATCLTERRKTHGPFDGEKQFRDYIHQEERCTDQTTELTGCTRLDRTSSVDTLMTLPPPIRHVDHSNLRGLDLAMVGRKECIDEVDDYAVSTLNFTVIQVQAALRQRSKKAQQQHMKVLRTAREDTEAMVRSQTMEINRLKQENEEAQKILLDLKMKNQQLQETNKTYEANIEKLTAANTKLTNQVELLNLNIEVKSPSENDKEGRMEELHLVEGKHQEGALKKEKRDPETERRSPGPENASDASIAEKLPDTAEKVTFQLLFESMKKPYGPTIVTAPGSQRILEALQADPRLQKIKDLQKVFLDPLDGSNIKGEPNIGSPCSSIAGGTFKARFNTKLPDGQGLSVYDDDGLKALERYRFYIDVIEQRSRSQWITKMEPTKFHFRTLLIDCLPDDTLLSALLRDGRIDDRKVKFSILSECSEDSTPIMPPLTDCVRCHHDKTFVCKVLDEPQVAEVVWQEALKIDNSVGNVSKPTHGGRINLDREEEVIYKEHYHNVNQGTTVQMMEKLMGYSNSVGVIVNNDHPYGTCFRVGPRFVLTNKHVIDMAGLSSGSCSGAFVEFNFLEAFPNKEDLVRFNVKDVKHSQDELDYSIVELDIPTGQFQMVQERLPGLESLIGPTSEGSAVTIIGHAGGEPKKIDVHCPVFSPNDKKVSHYLKVNPSQTQDVYNPDWMIYRTTFARNSSGSPGFDQNGKLVVMHTRGYFLHAGSSSMLEQGIRLTAIFDDLRQNKPDLFCAIFPQNLWDMEYMDSS